MRTLSANAAAAAAGRRTHRPLVAAMCLGVMLAQLDTSLVNLATGELSGAMLALFLVSRRAHHRAGE